jgi:uncharacterized protein (UPF0333 family)
MTPTRSSGQLNLALSLLVAAVLCTAVWLLAK